VQLLNQLEHRIFDTIPLGGPSCVPDLKVNTQGQLLERYLNGDDGTALSLAAFANAIRLHEIPEMIEHAYRAGCKH